MIEVLKDIKIHFNKGGSMEHANVYKCNEHFYVIVTLQTGTSGNHTYDDSTTLVRFYKKARNGRYSECNTLPLELLQSF